MTLSSKCPLIPHTLIVVSLPITCAETIVTASQRTGFTLPGIIELPGWIAGS